MTIGKGWTLNSQQKLNSTFEANEIVKENTTMPDPGARRRLKKKMLDRWENEGGAIAADKTTVDDTCLTSEVKGQQKQSSSKRDNSTVSTSSKKRSKPTRK